MELARVVVAPSPAAYTTGAARPGDEGEGVDTEREVTLR